MLKVQQGGFCFAAIAEKGILQAAALPARLKAGRQVLALLIEVRILGGQPIPSQKNFPLSPVNTPWVGPVSICTIYSRFEQVAQSEQMKPMKIYNYSLRFTAAAALPWLLVALAQSQAFSGQTYLHSSYSLGSD